MSLTQDTKICQVTERGLCGATGGDELPLAYIYDKNLSLGRIRDYDNTEVQNVLNTAAAFFLRDDSGRLCDAYHTTKLGDTDCTRIYVMPQEAFPYFISSQINTPNEGSKSPENP